MNKRVEMARERVREEFIWWREYTPPFSGAKLTQETAAILAAATLRELENE